MVTQEWDHDEMLVQQAPMNQYEGFNPDYFLKQKQKDEQ